MINCFRIETIDASARDGVHPIALRAGSGYEYLLTRSTLRKEPAHPSGKLDPAEYVIC